MNITSNDPRRHHYVPQFYLRQFSDDGKKVKTLSSNGPFLIQGSKSISRIAYEDRLYTISDKSVNRCIEKDINFKLETPFSHSETWERISNNAYDSLSEVDALPLYIFMRHLQVRNVENLEFIKNEQRRCMSPEWSHNYTSEEIQMHRNIAATPNGAEEFFLLQSLDISTFISEFHRASIRVLTSRIPFRTSTNPVVFVPTGDIKHPDFKEGDTIRWLPFSASMGVLLIMNDLHSGFSGPTEAEEDLVRVLNRGYLIQTIQKNSVRHCIASDSFIHEDLAWAEYEALESNPRKFKERDQ